MLLASYYLFFTFLRSEALFRKESNRNDLSVAVKWSWKSVSLDARIQAD